MENLVPMFQAFLGLGPTVILPVFIFIIGLIFRCGPAKSFHSGLTIGVGFVGINLVVALLCDNLGPAAQAMIKNFGIQLNAIDIGWPGSASMAWASPIAAFVLPLALVVNIIMLFTKTTKTMDVDIWNYWHFTFCGACVYALTGSFWQAIVAAIIFEIVVLKIADWTAPYMEKYFDLPGVSVPTGSTCSYAPLGIPLIWLIQKIPVIKNLKADPDSIQKRFGENANIYIGLDAAVTTGHPAVIATALILVPITILLAVILPGNNVLPFGDLATIPFIVAMIVAAARGNIVHSVLAGIVVISLSLLMSTAMAEFQTTMGVIANFKMPEGSTLISSIDQAGNLINFIIFKAFALFN